jgi:NTP pyrophosphatase (non-canonical NTP hydrolase)
MELKKIAEFQRKFDEKHGWDWSKASDKEWLKHLQYASIALTGEIGEFSNLVKKVLREFNSTGNLPGKEMVEKMKEELTDIFIYLIKISDQLFHMDLSKKYIEKMKKNEERFKKYEL